MRTKALFYAVPLGGNHTVVNHKTWHRRWSRVSVRRKSQGM